jgi:acetyltransferase-like isoleucine patch superfamily enzyme
MSSIVESIKRSPKLKKLVLYLLTPKNQARPRWWIAVFVNPFFRKMGKGATIQSSARIDILPFNPFQLGDNSTIEDFCTVNNGMGGIYIGNNVRIGIGSVLIGPVRVGHHVRLAQNVVITALNHNYSDVSKPISEQGVNTKEVVIGDETWIGANSVILPGVNIGKHCVIAAGSVVTKPIPDYCVVAGNPARIIKKHNKSSDEWEKAEIIHNS